MPVQITIHTDRTSQLVRQGLEDLSREVPRIGKKRIYEAMRRVQRKLRIPKSRPGYPIQWDSERQRKAFFATDGFGRGIPTRRTGRSLQWELSHTGNGYTLQNPADYASHLYGHYDSRGQSRIFEADYPLFADMVDSEIEQLPDEIEEHITRYGKGLGF